MQVVVIGGGPAGLMAAIEAGKENDVLVLEKEETYGKKLKITGKGRCNITSSLPISEFISNIPGNGTFLYSAFKNFTNEDMIKFLKEEGVEVKEERGNRIFPASDKSDDVLQALLRKCKKEQVILKTNKKVIEILSKDDTVIGLKVEDTITKKQEIINSKKIILATGGKSYSATGSTGDGYILAKKLGHTIVKIMASLVPLECYEKNLCRQTQGLSLKNVKIEFVKQGIKKPIYEDFGEMVFTHFRCVRANYFKWFCSFTKSI